jgi:hypothetical protein
MSTPRTGAPVFPGDPGYFPAGDPRYVPPCRFLLVPGSFSGHENACGCGQRFDSLDELRAHVEEYNEAQLQRRHALDSAARGVGGAR